MSYKFKFRSCDFKSPSYEFKFTSYEFKSAIGRLEAPVEAIKPQVK